MSGTREMGGRLVAVANLKGGSRKSTLAVHLAGTFVERGRRVALLDADPQRTAFHWARRVGLPLAVEREALESVVDARRWVMRLLRLLDTFDYVVLDLPSVVGPAVASALLVGHVVLVPLAPTPIDMEGTRRTLRYVRTAREARGDRAARVRLVPFRIGRGDRDELALQRSLATLGEHLAPPIGEHPALAACFSAGVWIGEERSAAVALDEFRLLADAVERLAADAPDAPLLVRARALREDVPVAPKRPLRHLGSAGGSWWRRFAGRGRSDPQPAG